MYRFISGCLVTLNLYLVLSLAGATPGQLYSNLHEKNNFKQPILVLESSHNYTKTLEHVRRAIKGMNFRMIKEQNLDEGFELNPGNSRQRIIYFCNFAKVNKAINFDHRIGQFLPCRITVIESNGKVFVTAVNPKSISVFMDNKKLNDICDEMYEMYVALISEATF